MWIITWREYCCGNFRLPCRISTHLVSWLILGEYNCSLSVIILVLTAFKQMSLISRQWRARNYCFRRTRPLGFLAINKAVSISNPNTAHQFSNDYVENTTDAVCTSHNMQIISIKSRPVRYMKFVFIKLEYALVPWTNNNCWELVWTAISFSLKAYVFVYNLKNIKLLFFS